MCRLKQMELHESYQMILFDVKSLFTDVPLNDIIDTLLRHIHKEIKLD